MQVSNEQSYKMKLKRIFLNMLAGANLVALLFLLFLCFTTWLSPTEYPRLSIVGLGFPFVVLMNLLFLAFWLVFYIRYIWIPILGFLLSFSYLRDYWPVNWSQTPPEDCLKLLTYNVAGFRDGGTIHEDGQHGIIRYLQQSGADIICLQEAYAGRTRQELDQEMQHLGYTVIPSIGGHDMEHAYSKVPVLKSERVAIESDTNGAMAYWLKTGEDTLCLINCHLESNHLTAEDKDVYHDMLDSLNNRNRVESGARLLIKKLSVASARRGLQVDSIRKFYKKEGISVIVCGDFNDSPISYTCRRFSKDLNSAFVQSGNGPGISYNQKGFWFRIDHIFCSEDWQTYATKIDKSIDASDHYPLYTYLRKVKKPVKG